MAKSFNKKSLNFKICVQKIGKYLKFALLPWMPLGALEGTWNGWLIQPFKFFSGLSFFEMVQLPSSKLVMNLPWPSKSFTVNENQMGSAVIEILRYEKTPDTFMNVNFSFRLNLCLGKRLLILGAKLLYNRKILLTYQTGSVPHLRDHADYSLLSLQLGISFNLKYFFYELKHAIPFLYVLVLLYISLFEY